jgi:hypothetical protein
MQKEHVSMIQSPGIVWIPAAMFSRQRLQVTKNPENDELGSWKMKTVERDFCLLFSTDGKMQQTS